MTLHLAVLVGLSVRLFIRNIFSRGHATLHLAVSVVRSVGMSVPPVLRHIFEFRAVFCITALAQPSATGLPCIRPCLEGELDSQFPEIKDVNVFTGLMVEISQIAS